MSRLVLDFVSAILFKLFSRNPDALPRLPRFMKFPNANTTSSTYVCRAMKDTCTSHSPLTLQNLMRKLIYLFQFFACFQFFAWVMNSFNLRSDIFDTITERLLEEERLETLIVARNSTSMERKREKMAELKIHTQCTCTYLLISSRKRSARANDSISWAWLVSSSLSAIVGTYLSSCSTVSFSSWSSLSIVITTRWIWIYTFDHEDWTVNSGAPRSLVWTLLGQK